VPIDLEKVDVTRTHWPFLRDAESTPTAILNEAFHRLSMGGVENAERRPRWGFTCRPSGSRRKQSGSRATQTRFLARSVPPKSLTYLREFVGRSADLNSCASIAPLDWRPRATIVRKAGADLAKVKFYNQSTNDAWCRDHGPIFVKRRQTGECFDDGGTTRGRKIIRP